MSRVISVFYQGIHLEIKLNDAVKLKKKNIPN